MFWNYFQDFQKVLEAPHTYRNSCELEKWNYMNPYCNLKAGDAFIRYYFLTHFVKQSSPRDQWKKKQAREIKEPKAVSSKPLNQRKREEMLNIWQQKAVHPSLMCWFHCIISLSNAFLALDVTNLPGPQKHDWANAHVKGVGIF